MIIQAVTYRGRNMFFLRTLPSILPLSFGKTNVGTPEIKYRGRLDKLNSLAIFGCHVRTHILFVWGQLIFMLVLEIEASKPLINDLKSY